MMSDFFDLSFNLFDFFNLTFISLIFAQFLVQFLCPSLVRPLPWLSMARSMPSGSKGVEGPAVVTDTVVVPHRTGSH
jgi:hypothetical protein